MMHKSFINKMYNNILQKIYIYTITYKGYIYEIIYTR